MGAYWAGSLIKNKPKSKKMRTPINKEKLPMEVHADICEGECLEREIEKAYANGTPINGFSPIIYTPRKDGVRPEFDVRTDRFEQAMEAMDKTTASYRAAREEFYKPKDNPLTGEATETAEA